MSLRWWKRCGEFSVLDGMNAVMPATANSSALHCRVLPHVKFSTLISWKFSNDSCNSFRVLMQRWQTNIVLNTGDRKQYLAGYRPNDVNPLQCRGIVVQHRIIRSWYTGRWWVGCYIWYSEEGTGRGRSPPSPLLAVPNVTAHPSTASVQITVFLYNGPLLCGFNVSMKG